MCKKLSARDNYELAGIDWYRFSRSQSLDKTGFGKLIAAGTVQHLQISWDQSGELFLTGGRVDGIVASKDIEPMYLLGLLNGAVCDFIFRRTGRVKQGNFFEANKQFIAPLPIPKATPAQQKDIATRARSLQKRWTKRRELIQAASERLAVLPRSSKGRRSLWPDFPSLDAATENAPKALTQKSERREWADACLKELEATRLSALQAMLDGGAALEANFTKGELTLSAGGARGPDKLYLDERHGQLAEAHWRYLLLRQSWRDAASFANELARLPDDTGSQAAKQFLDRVAALGAECAAIAQEERDMNERLYELYNLSANERLLVESGRR